MTPEEESELSDYRRLCELQRKRMNEATEMWRQATGRHDVLPDLGNLLTWLMDEIRRLEIRPGD